MKYIILLILLFGLTYFGTSYFRQNNDIQNTQEFLDNTEILDLSNQNLTGALQAEIKNMKNLKVLNLSNNKFTGVPAEVGQLDKLEVLDLSNNPITGLPHEIGNLQNLKTLNLKGTNYSKQDLEIIKQNLPSTTEILVD